MLSAPRPRCRAAAPTITGSGSRGGNTLRPLVFYEYRARAYNPTLGRFMSEDPKLFDAGDYNLFRYCHNDPEDLTDPMGLWEEYHYPRTYEQLAAKIQWENRYSTGGAIGIGTAIHQAWGALSNAMGVAVTGQVIGGRVDYARVPVGNPNDPNAPSKLEIIGADAHDTYTNYRLQLQTAKDRDLMGSGAALENVKVERTTGNIFIQEQRTTNNMFVPFRKGVITDQVGLKPQSARAYGEVFKNQSYEVYYDGFRYNIGSRFQQHSTVVNGQVTNELIPVGP